jgi:predicted house-cleaning NTP pyrophosphatase (Maf/HAM1 superfamily)
LFSAADKKDFDVRSFHAGTDVTFAEVDDITIRKYIDTGEPM